MPEHAKNTTKKQEVLGPEKQSPDEKVPGIEEPDASKQRECTPQTTSEPSPFQRDFDHANYRRDLETLLKYAYDEYRHICLERQRSQLTYIRHYLWFAALLMGTGTPLFWFLKNPIAEVVWLSKEPPLLFYLACITSIGVALAVLALGIDTLRGREIMHLPFGKFMDHAQNAYECALEGAFRPTMLTTLINNIDAANAAHIPKIHSVGLKLRWMSRLLLISLASAVMATLSRITLA